jgi:hypothetical protein
MFERATTTSPPENHDQPPHFRKNPTKTTKTTATKKSRIKATNGIK